MDQLTYSLGASPASHTAPLENNLERMMTETSGRKCVESYKRQSPVGCLVRTLLMSPIWCSMKSRLTWKHSVTRSGNHSSFRLVVSMRTTNGTEFGFVPTPTRVDYKGAVKKRFRGSPHYRSNLPEFLRVTEADNAYPNPKCYEAFMGYPEGWTELQHSETQ